MQAHPDPTTGPRANRAALVLSGGVALGAYEAGACSALLSEPTLQIDWIAGVSIGAVNAALIAGSAPGRAGETLRAFWAEMGERPLFSMRSWLQAPGSGWWRELQNEASAFETLLFGRPGLFRPRSYPAARVGVPDVPALFDLAPLLDTVSRYVDFARLNETGPRVTLCCTDVLTGKRVVFDSGRGDRIGPEHVVGSSALLPLFTPVEIGGRLLGDGALSGNAPVDVVLQEGGGAERLCFVIELFGPAGQRPHTLAAAANRSAELVFGSQTDRILESWSREQRLRDAIARLGAKLPEPLQGDAEVAALLEEARPSRLLVRKIDYRGGLEEAGLLKSLDFSRATLQDRWRAGEEAARRSLGVPERYGDVSSA